MTTMAIIVSQCPIAVPGTRKEERLLSPAELEASHQIRRTMIDRDPRRSMETLLERMGKVASNADFVKDFGSQGGFR